MSFTKKINVNDGSGQKFEDNTVGELQFDMKPEVGSFNAVTSDAVARAVAGASGEVPQVTESDNGKVLKAIYDEGGPAVEWGEGVAVDQTYDATSANAQSGVAVASAIAQIPSGGGAEYTEDDGEMTLGESCDSSGVVVTSQGPLSISKSGGLMGYGKITTNCLIKENGSLVDKVKVTFNNGLAEAVGTVIASGTSAGDTYMTIAVPVFGVYNFSATLDNIFMEITLTGAESGHTYSYDDSGSSDDHIRMVEMYWI